MFLYFPWIMFGESRANTSFCVELHTSILAIETVDDWKAVREGEARDKELVRVRRPAWFLGNRVLVLPCL